MQLGHVQLRVRDLERSRTFYERLLGWPTRETGRGVVFLGAGPEHHQLALLAVGDVPSAPFAIGLSHIAFDVGSRETFVEVYRRLAGSGAAVSGFDLGVSWSLYLRDPDGNEIELYCDTRQAPDGRDTWQGRGTGLDLKQAIERAGAAAAALG
jgi:catechol 2,3-dioxygenase